MASVRRRVKDDPKSPWIVTYTDPATKKRVQGGTFAKRKDADAARLRIETEIEGGVHTSASASVSVRRAADEYMRDCDRRHHIGDRMSGYTLMNYRIYAKKITERFGDMMVTDLSRVEAQDWIDDLAGQYSKKTVGRANLVLNEIMKFAVRKGWLRRNALKDDPVRLPNTPNKRVRVPNREDIRALLAAIEAPQVGKPNLRNHLTRGAIIALGIFTGMRRGEMAGLQWEDVDFENNLIHVRHNLSRIDGLKPPKTDAGNRKIHMVQPLRRALLALRDYWALREEMYDERSPTNTLGYFRVRHSLRVKRGDKAKPGRVMTGPVLRLVRVAGSTKSKVISREWGYGRPVSLADMTGAHWKAIMKAAGLVDKGGKPIFTMHAMRHACASLLIENGVPAFNLKEVMGHASVQTTYSVYGHLFPDDGRARDAMNEIAASFQAT